MTAIVEMIAAVLAAGENMRSRTSPAAADSLEVYEAAERLSAELAAEVGRHLRSRRPTYVRGHRTGLLLALVASLNLEVSDAQELVRAVMRDLTTRSST